MRHVFTVIYKILDMNHREHTYATIIRLNYMSERSSIRNLLHIKGIKHKRSVKTDPYSLSADCVMKAKCGMLSVYKAAA